MSRISYVNGRYLPHAEANVHIEDRGYQFADGIYEYIAYYNRRFVDEAGHLDRLERSLRELAIPMPMSRRALMLVMRELVAQNLRDDGGLYIQVSRGVAPRNHPYPANLRPSLVMTVCGAKLPKEKEIAEGVRVVTAPDLRWARRDIKSIALLPNIMARQLSYSQGARETWMIDEQGMITEGSASNAYIVNNKGEILTRQASSAILRGITRDSVLASLGKMVVVERPFSLQEAYDAKEAFITSTSANVLPVTRIDDRVIGDGKPGAVAMQLLKNYLQLIYKQTGKLLYERYYSGEAAPQHDAAA